MLKLKEVMKTMYIHDELVGEFRQAMSLGDEFDLANCKFSPNMEAELRKYYHTKVFIDSDNAIINSYLEHNMKVPANIENNKDKYKNLKLDFKQGSEIINYIKHELETDKIYKVSGNDSTITAREISILILIIAIRPDVKVDLGDMTSRLFNQVRLDFLTSSIGNHYDEYNEVVGSCVVTRRVVDGKVQLPFENSMSEREFFERKIALPVAFGTEVLRPNSEWKSVLEQASRVLMETESKVLLMKDLIEIIE